MKKKIIEILKNNYIEDSPDLILELFAQEKAKIRKEVLMEISPNKLCQNCGEEKENEIGLNCKKCEER